MKLLSVTFTEVYNQSLQIIKTIYNGVKEDDLIKNLNDIIKFIKLLLLILL